MVLRGGGRHTSSGRGLGKGSSRPHGRGSRRNYGMKGYSRYGSIGQGLTDAAQNAYNAVQRSKLTSGVDRAIFDRATMTYRLDGVDIFRGMYQLPGSPKYSGGEGSFEAPTAIQQAAAMRAYRRQVEAAEGRAKATGNQFGAITTGKGRENRRYPAWVMQMLKGAGTELGKPPKTTGNSKVPVGLALVALKVLL